MAGIISNVDKDVQELRKLKNAIEDVKKSLKGINIKVDIDIAKGLQTQLKSLTNQYNELVDKIAQAEAKVLLSAKKINDSTEKIIKAQEKVSKINISPAQSGNANTQTNTAETASIQAQAKAYEDLKAEIDNVLNKRELNISGLIKEQKAIDLLKKSIAGVEKGIRGSNGSPTSGQIRLLGYYNEQLLAHKAALSEVRQALNNNMKLNNATATSMNELSQSLSRMRIAYRDLTEEERNSPFGKELLASIKQADAKIKELDATIGNHQRNVGNYGAQWNGLQYQIQMVTRELPNFAINPQIGIMSLTNNIPYLVDELSKAKKAYKEYIAAVKAGQTDLKAVPSVGKQVLSSLLNWQTAITMGITLITAYRKEISNWIAGLFGVSDATKSIIDIQKQLNEVQLKGTQNAQAEITKLDLLYKATQNAAKPINERKKAIDELQKNYPDFFKNLSDEEILAGKAANSYVRLSSAIIASARARAAQEKMTENAKKILENEEKITEAYVERGKRQATLEKEQKTLANLSNNGEAQEFQVGIVRSAQKRVDEVDERIANLRREIYETNKAQNELSKNINIDDLIFNANNDSFSKQQKEADKLRKQQEELAEDLLSLRRKNQQDEIGLMADGREKKLAQIDADFDAQTQAIEKKAKELAKANKEAGITDVNKDGLTKDQQDEIDKARKLNLKARAKEESNLYKAEAEAMRNYLKEYGTFQQQKLAITEEYAEKIRKAQSEGERLSLEKERDSALLGVDVKAAQQNINWQSVFGDLGLMLREQIQPTIDNLKKITQSDEFNNSSVEDQQRIYDILSQLERQSGMLGKDMFKDVAKDLELYRNSLNAYNKAQQREVEATNALVKAKENLKRAQENGGDVESARKAVDEAESIFNRTSESVKALGDRAAENAEALKTSSEKVRGALGNLAGGLDKLKSDSLSQAFDGVKDIGKSLGGKIGDAIANIDPTGIIGGVLTILDVLKDGVSSIFVSLQDTLYGAIEGILDDVFSGDIIVKPIQNTLGHIGKILDTVTFGGFSSWFGIGGNAKEVQKTIDRLTERNEILGKSIDRLTDIMEKSAGSKAISAYEEARKNQQEKNENLLDIAQAQASYHNSHKSWQYYMRWTDEQLKWAQDNVDASFTGTNSLWNLTPEQMNKLLSNVNIYEQIKNAGKGGYGGRVMEDLEEYAEQAGKIADLEASINESLMNVSFDSLRSSFLDSLMDMEKDAKEFSDDFSEMLQRALLDFSLGETFDNDLKDWYNDVAKAIKDNDGKLSDIQMDDFKRRYDGIVNAAIYERDKIAELTGYTGGKDDTREASQKGIATASQDSVDENNGRLAVMQEHTFTINENISRTAAGIDTIVTHTANLSCLANIDRTMQSILSTRDAALTHLSNIDGHTSRLEAIEHAIVFMKNDINTMLIKGLKLSR